ncbi:MAG: hypothetical protein KCHDKBKB_01840 [Elusimicrobia bacterium]|nr:hypothetical protein [Elusimicrobiota bacterium]
MRDLLSTLIHTAIICFSVVMSDLFLQKLFRLAFKKRVLLLELLILIALTGVGGFFMMNLASPLRFAGACLFMTGMIVYLQCKSVFSRGYSIRILADLMDRGGSSTIESLKNGYGGMGLQGMLRKRLLSLHSLGLLHINETLVGPLTPKGLWLARFSDFFRRVLKLERVG